MRRPQIRASILFIAAVLLCTSVYGQSKPTKSFLWKASNHQGMIYLVGSVHLLTKDYYPLNPSLDAAFKESDLLVEELDLGEMEGPDSQMRMLMRSQLPQGQSLDKVVSPGTYGL